MLDTAQYCKLCLIYTTFRKLDLLLHLMREVNPASEMSYHFNISKNMENE
jgi:hypothetical protein